MVESEKTCKHPGCGKVYRESENSDTSCKFHNGKPIFHDVKKGWTCCNVVVYDWDEFQKIPGCTYGKHTDLVSTTDFFKSNTVENAKKALDNAKPVVIRSIDDYNKEQE